MFEIYHRQWWYWPLFVALYFAPAAFIMLLGGVLELFA